MTDEPSSEHLRETVIDRRVVHHGQYMTSGRTPSSTPTAASTRATSSTTPAPSRSSPSTTRTGCCCPPVAVGHRPGAPGDPRGHARPARRAASNSPTWPRLGSLARRPASTPARGASSATSRPRPASRPRTCTSTWRSSSRRSRDTPDPSRTSGWTSSGCAWSDAVRECLEGGFHDAKTIVGILWVDRVRGRRDG